jgi:hypothetical protein
MSFAEIADELDFPNAAAISLGSAHCHRQPRPAKALPPRRERHD